MISILMMGAMNKVLMKLCGIILPMEAAGSSTSWLMSQTPSD